MPREGHDGVARGRLTAEPDFNPRAPRGARPFRPKYANSLSLFQSTCPARGTTSSQDSKRRSKKYFNPRAPRGARHLVYNISPVHIYFNPRAPRGARPHRRNVDNHFTRFQSTCPARGTTSAQRSCCGSV